VLGLGQLQFPLSQQYKIGLNVDLSKLASEYSREQLRDQRSKTVLDVRKAYYGILAADGARVAAAESLALGREVERVVGDRYRSQKALEVDEIEARARRADAETSDIRAANLLAQRKESLNSLMGRDLAADFQVVPVPDVAPSAGDLAAARARAL